MDSSQPVAPCFAVDALIDRVGRHAWRARMEELKNSCRQTYSGRALASRHAVELTVERLRRGAIRASGGAETCIAALAGGLADLADRLNQAGRIRLDAALAQAITADNTLVPLFHLLRTARIHEARGFEIGFEGWESGAPFDLLLRRDSTEAEIACDVISAEAGRGVHRGAWFQLMDRIDPDLQSWLTTHPGRYLLKMTLPQGLKGHEAPGPASLAELHRRITRLLTEQRRADHDETAVLRLDPLWLAAAQASQLALMPRLREAFGPEAHLAVTAAGNGVFVMAARAGQEDEVAVAVRRRMSEIVPTRLTGARPGILAMFIEDTDRLEWRGLREQLRLEGEARQFMTRPEARAVVAVTCTSRQELLAVAAPEAELRFRNPNHPQAKAASLAPAVLSSN